MLYESIHNYLMAMQWMFRRYVTVQGMRLSLSYSLTSSLTKPKTWPLTFGKQALEWPWRPLTFTCWKSVVSHACPCHLRYLHLLLVCRNKQNSWRLFMAKVGCANQPFAEVKVAVLMSRAAFAQSSQWLEHMLDLNLKDSTKTQITLQPTDLS